MKRTAAAFVLVAGLGGCVSPDAGNKQATGTGTEPRMTAPTDSAMRPVGSAKRTDPSVMQASALGVDNVSGVRQASGYGRVRGAVAPPTEATFGPMERGLGTALGYGGITPAAPMGPPGAVALHPAAMGGMGMAGGGMGGMYANGRTSIRFASPGGMRIAFMDGGRGFADAGREAPVRYNFVQGSIYRVRLNNIPNRPGKNYYPTIEIYPPSNKESMTFLSHSAVPVGFTDEDFEQVNAGNMVVKVIYLPSAQFQDVAAAEEIVSTRLEPGTDPVGEANRRGTVLAVVRIGNIDLEDPTTPAMDAPAGMGGGGPAMGAPKMMPVPMAPGPMMPPPSGLAPTKSPEPIPSVSKGAKVPADLPSISLPPASAAK